MCFLGSVNVRIMYMFLFSGGTDRGCRRLSLVQYFILWSSRFGVCEIFFL